MATFIVFKSILTSWMIPRKTYSLVTELVLIKYEQELINITQSCSMVLLNSLKKILKRVKNK